MLRPLALLALILTIGFAFFDIVNGKPVENAVQRLRIVLAESNKGHLLSAADVHGQESLKLQIEGLGELSVDLKPNSDGVLELDWDWRWFACSFCQSGFTVLKKELNDGIGLTKDALKAAIDRQCKTKLGPVGGKVCSFVADLGVDVLYDMILEDKRIDPLKCCQKLGLCKLKNTPFGIIHLETTADVKS